MLELVEALPPEQQPRSQVHILRSDTVGVANGMVVLQNEDHDGMIMPVEVKLLYTTGGFVIATNDVMSDVMKESLRLCRDWIKAQARQQGLDKKTLETTKLNVNTTHQGPKDGPSAGVAFLCASMSRLKDKPVRADIALTGEITHDGRVLKIGGLDKKLQGAVESGIRTAIIPEANHEDLQQVSQGIKQNIRIVTVRTVEDALEEALAARPLCLPYHRTPDHRLPALLRPSLLQ